MTIRNKIVILLTVFVILYAFWLVGGDPVKNESGDVQVTTSTVHCTDDSLTCAP